MALRYNADRSLVTNDGYEWMTPAQARARGLDLSTAATHTPAPASQQTQTSRSTAPTARTNVPSSQVPLNEAGNGLASGWTQTGTDRYGNPLFSLTGPEEPTRQQTAPTSPTQSSPYQAPTANRPGQVDLSRYGVTNPEYITQDQMDRIRQDYDDVSISTSQVGNTIRATGVSGSLIPKATVINNQGQRVTVRTDNRPGTAWPPANQYLAAGFRLESAPGIAPGSTQNAPGTLNLGLGAAGVSQTGGRAGGAGGNVVGVDGDIQTFGDGSQINIRTGQVITPPGGQSGGSSMTVGGIDTSGWSDQERLAFQGVLSYVQTIQDQGMRLNPTIEITPEMTQRFLDQARTEVAPYYSQAIRQTQEDLTRNLTRTAEDYATTERGIGREYGQALEGAQRDFASRGLEFSSDRDKTERTLAENTQTALEAAQRNALRAGQDAGTTGERTLGSSFLPSNATNISINTGARPITNQPGVYGITPSSGSSRNLFTSVGGTTGSIERERMTAEQTRQQNLITAERQLRGTQYA
jgi:hypothetical protein